MIFSIYNLNDNSELNLYFALKEKKERRLSPIEKDKILKEIKDYINKLGKYDYLIYPESSHTFLKEIIELFNIANTVELKKNNKEDILKKILELKLSKQEKESQINRVNKMNGFKLNEIKTNKRAMYIPFIFEKTKINNINNKKILIVDDSMFSSSTYKAILEATSLSGTKVDIFVPFKR